MNAHTQQSLISLVLNDKTLQDKLAHASDPDSAALILADAANRQGIEVSAQSIAHARTAQGVLGDEQLAAVSGGGFLNDIWDALITPFKGEGRTHPYD